MMRIKKSNFIDEVRDPYNDSIDVEIEFEDGYSYTIVVRTPMIVVKKLTKEIVTYLVSGLASAITQRIWR